MYLSGREPIMVNSNYYGMDMFYLVPTNRQISRAATVVHAMFAFRSSLDREEVKPVNLQMINHSDLLAYRRVDAVCCNRHIFADNDQFCRSVM